MIRPLAVDCRRSVFLSHLALARNCSETTASSTVSQARPHRELCLSTFETKPQGLARYPFPKSPSSGRGLTKKNVHGPPSYVAEGGTGLSRQSSLSLFINLILLMLVGRDFDGILDGHAIIILGKNDVGLIAFLALLPTLTGILLHIRSGIILIDNLKT